MKTAEQESNCSSTGSSQSDGDCNVVLEVIEKLPLTSSSSSIALPEKPMEQDNDLQTQLNLANWKAEESMRALLQLAEGVRLVTRQMKTYSLSASDGSDQDNCSMASEGTDGSCNSSSSAFKTTGRNRAYSTGTVGSCSSSVLLLSEEDRKIHDLSVRLEGPIGADLMGLSSAAHMVHEHARWANHEASLLTQDAAVATKAADEALARTERAERAVQRLYQETKSLRTQLQQHRIERKVLAREVRSLRKENKSLRGYLQDTKRIELMLALEQHVHRAMDAHEIHMKQQTTKLRAKTLSEDYVVTDEFDESIMMMDPTNNNHDQSLSTTEQNETTTAAPVKEEEEEEKKKKKEPTKANEQQVEDLPENNNGPQHPQDVTKTEPVSVDANRASDEDDKKKEEEKDQAATTVDTKTKPKGKPRKPPHRSAGGAFGAFGGVAALTVKPAWVLKSSYPAYRVPTVAAKTTKKTSAAAAAAASTDAKKSEAPASANAAETLSSETDSLAPSSRKENVRNDNVNKDNPKNEPGAPERTSSTNTTKAHENKENRYQPLQLASKAKAPPLTSKFAGYFQRPLVPRKPSTKKISTTTTTKTSTTATTATSSTKESTVVSSSSDSLPKEDCPHSATNNNKDNNNKTKPTRLEIPRHVTLGRQSLLSPFGSDDSPVAAAASGRQSDIDGLCDARVLRSLALPEELSSSSSSTTPGGVGSAPYCCPSEIARIYEQIENLYEC